jgi:predicted nucleic acid-binding protein
MPGETEVDIYLDVCIVIYLVECHPHLASPIQESLLRHADARIVWTDLTRLESRTKPLRENNRRTLNQFDIFFRAPNARMIELTTGVFDLATELRARHGLKTPDALHLAAAGRIVLVTFA